MNPWWARQEGYFGSFYIAQDTSRSHEASIFERTAREVDGIERFMRQGEAQSILDCPCGYGRHSIELAHRGHHVWGVDLNRKHLHKAEEDARRQHLHGRLAFEQKHMLDVSYLAKFDLVINMCASFGFFETDEENRKLLEVFFASLRDGGGAIIHVDVNMTDLEGSTGPHVNEKQLSDGSRLLIHDSFDAATRRIEGRWSIERNGIVSETRTYSVRIYDREELEAMCRHVGFADVTAYGDWDASPYRRDSSDMIIVAHK